MMRRIISALSLSLLLVVSVYGQSVEASYSEWLQSAKRGDPHAKAMVAYHLKNGIGVEKSLDDATRWALSAATQSGLANWLLAQMHVGRKGKMEYLEAALSNNYPLVAPLYARLYLNGSDYFGIKSSKRNQDMAIDYFQKAANSGFAEDAAYLGYHFLNEAKDNAKAFHYFNMAAKSGDVESMAMVANMLFFGVGTSRNDRAAFEWYKKAAEGGSQSGIEGLADCYRLGVGVLPDQDEAFRNYMKITSPTPRVQYILGYYYANKTNPSEEDLSKAKSLLWYSEIFGDLYSRAFRGISLFEGAAPFEKDIEQAHTYLELVYADKDFNTLPAALRQKVYKYLSGYYRYGIDVDENLSLAEQLFEKAEELQSEVDRSQGPYAFAGPRSAEEALGSYSLKLSPASEVLKQVVLTTNV